MAAEQKKNMKNTLVSYFNMHTARFISKYTTFSIPENVFEFLMKSKFSPWTSAESSKVLRRRKWNKGVYSPPWSSINASESFDV